MTLSRLISNREDILIAMTGNSKTAPSCAGKDTIRLRKKIKEKRITLLFQSEQGDSRAR